MLTFESSKGVYMKFLNDRVSYGFLSVLLHWSMAAAIIALFATGLIIEELDYTDALYQILPQWHFGVGFVFLIIYFIRLLSKVIQISPVSKAHNPIERKLAISVHHLLYLLMLVSFVSGYAWYSYEAEPVEFLGIFTIPVFDSISSDLLRQIKKIHEPSVFALIGLASIHALAGLKHFLRRD